jgi:hypothetical protein
VRAAMFAWEALVSAECKGYAWDDWEIRKAAGEDLEERSRAAHCDPCWRDAYRTVRTLRNALAHGTPPQDGRSRDLLASPEKLRAALKGALDRLLP